MLRITGRIYTGLMTPATTDCVLVGDDGKIAAVGEQAVCAAGPDSSGPASALRRPIEEIRLGTRAACPGFIDAHVHLEGLARELTQLAVGDARSLEELLARVREAAAALGRERAVFGSGWDESTWAAQDLPTRERLDRAAPVHAVILRRVCGHLWAVNSEALRRVAARTDLTPAQRERLAVVRSDGLLREDDIALAAPLAEPTPEERRDGLLRACRHALSLGITGVQDMGNVGEAALELDGKGLVPLRVVAAVSTGLGAGAPGAPPAWRAGRRVSPGALKLFLDGSIGAQTAAISEPFSDDPGNRGVLLHDERKLVEELLPFHERGVQIALHAIGDRAIEQALDVFERLDARRPVAELRHRIEHLEIVTDEQVGRLAALGVIASMQPNFVGRWQRPGGLYERRLGERHRRLNPFRKIVAAGARLAFGSDGMPMGPLYGIRSAMKHPAAAESLTFVEALHAYTLGSAFAGRIDRLTGSIEPGKEADIVILSADPAAGGEDVSVEAVLAAGRKSETRGRKPG